MDEASSTPVIAPVDATLGATVTGIDLRAPDDAQWAAVLQAFDEHALLIFPGQHLSDADQEAFALRFGEIEQLSTTGRTTAISTNRSDMSDAATFEHLARLQKGNEIWHTDSSYMPVSAKASVLSARAVPSSGAGTEWADMRAGYDALDDQTKHQIAELAAHHSLYYSQAQLGHVVEPGFAYGFHEEGAPLRPLVKIHPSTGRPALFIGRHAHAVPGLSSDESAALLDRLHDLACRPPRVYEHRWTVGDVVIWDNRCVLHRAKPNETGEVRSLHHTRVAGDPATESAPTSATVR